jgi:hypothetical protein
MGAGAAAIRAGGCGGAHADTAADDRSVMARRDFMSRGGYEVQRPGRLTGSGFIAMTIGTSTDNFFEDDFVELSF